MVARVINARNHDLRFVNSGVKEAVLRGEAVVVRSAFHLHGLAAGLRGGQVTVMGDVGDYLGALNDGARIEVNGNSGKFTADNMTSGEIVVDGSAGYGSGIGMYGGALLIRGNSGDYTAVINKRGTIIVLGNVGEFLGVYMVGGDVVVLGDAGRNLGDWMIRGTICVRGEIASLGHNTKCMTVAQDDREKLTSLFETYAIDADPSDFRKVIPESIRPFYGR